MKLVVCELDYSARPRAARRQLLTNNPAIRRGNIDKAYNAIDLLNKRLFQRLLDLDFFRITAASENL